MTGAANPPSASPVLVVDDDGDMCRLLEIALATAGCEATTTGSALSAIALMEERPFRLVFVDARLPDMNGWQLIDALRQRRPAIRIVMISGYYFEDDIRVARALQAAEIDGFLAKPFQIEAVVAIAAGLGGDGRRRPQRSGAAARLCPVAPVRDCSTDAPTN